MQRDDVNKELQRLRKENTAPKLQLTGLKSVHDADLRHSREENDAETSQVAALDSKYGKFVVKITSVSLESLDFKSKMIDQLGHSGTGRTNASIYMNIFINCSGAFGSWIYLRRNRKCNLNWRTIE
jgi:hypothetical protein